jgi:hypothetical protein
MSEVKVKGDVNKFSAIFLVFVEAAFTFGAALNSFP